jgi:HSP20 family protein
MATRFPISSLAGDMVSLRSAMDRLFNESFVPGAMQATGRNVLPLDVYSNENEVVVLAAVPGMNPEDLNISIDKSTVTLSGTLRSASDSEEGKNASWHLSELTYGSFERSLTLPFQFDANRAEATFDNGMLRLVLPKAESEKPRQIKVTVGSGGQQPAQVTGTSESSETAE